MLTDGPAVFGTPNRRSCASSRAIIVAQARMMQHHPMRVFSIGQLHLSSESPKGVIFRPRGACELGPLLPQQQTCDDCFGMSVLCRFCCESSLLAWRGL
jgi:hypothetical protein